MQHQDRGLFLAEVARVLAESGFQRSPNAATTELTQHIDYLLDGFLLESQPIVGTEATILLADIRGFTALTASLPTETVIRLLNRFFAAMSCIVHRHGGAIDKFMGDSVMALFGAPHKREDDALRALACAVEMQQAIAELNLEAEAQGEPRIYAGIAVNTGHVMAGSFGSHRYSEYTVIGDAVNLVARMESFSLRGQVLISESTLARADGRVRIAGSNQVLVKGKPEPLRLYELRAVHHGRRLVVPRVEIRRSPRVDVDLPVTLQPIEHKRVLPSLLQGRALDLGYNGMRVKVPVRLPPCSDITVSLTPSEIEAPMANLYAKVISSSPRQGQFESSLQFTSIDTPPHARMKQYVDGLLWSR